jgi:hypothetical protein
MLQASLESLGASVFVLLVVDVCCRIAWRMVWVMMVGMSESGMLVDNLVSLLARSNSPSATMLKVGRVVVNEYGQVLR